MFSREFWEFKKNAPKKKTLIEFTQPHLCAILAALNYYTSKQPDSQIELNHMEFLNKFSELLCYHLYSSASECDKQIMKLSKWADCKLVKPQLNPRGLPTVIIIEEENNETEN